MRRIARELGVAASSVSVWVRDIRTPACSERELPTAAPASADMCEQRECGRCRRNLPITDFNRRGTDYQWWCRHCFREYFRKRGQLHRDQVKKAERRRRAVAREQAVDYLRRHPCVDCGETDIVVLGFDHIADKRATITDLIAEGASWRRIAEEIARCEVVCANCHGRRTERRQGSWRMGLTMPDDEYLAISRWRRRRNVLYVRDVLTESSCVDCSEKDVCVLEFDHVSGDKNATVSKMMWGEYSLAALAAEIARCQVRCANCHRRRTAKQAGFFRHDVIAPVAQSPRAVGF